jgi:DNA repair exonuclease SbcCD ATPase subunit
MMNETHGGVDGRTSSTTDVERWVSCEIPGCVNRMPYAGRGAPPKYCGQTVDGVRHTRLTAHRLAKGQVTLPTPGGGVPASATEPRRGENRYGDEARPVTAARMTLELLLAEVRDQVLSHEQRMAALAKRITDALRTAADLDAATAEVAAGHRQARTAIDAAETERDAALRGAQQTRRSAEEATERDQARRERDELASTVTELREQLTAAQTQATTARADTERTSHRLQNTTSELAEAQVQIEQFREQLATVRQEAADLMAGRAGLVHRLTAESDCAEQQRHRAETAEQHASRASGQVEVLSAELTTAREQLQHWQSHAAEQRAELAGLRSELTAARTAIETEKAHSAQRLADQQARHEETVSELRAQLHEAGYPPQHRRTSRRAAVQDR